MDMKSRSEPPPPSPPPNHALPTQYAPLLAPGKPVLQDPLLNIRILQTDHFSHFHKFAHSDELKGFNHNKHVFINFGMTKIKVRH